MATKHFCDATGEEILGKVCVIDFLVHVTRHDVNGYNDAQGERCSGREDRYVVSQKTYNEVMSVAWDKFEEIQRRHNILDDK